MNANIARDAERRIKQSLHRFASIKAWISASMGIILVVAAPSFVSTAEASGAPMAREMGIVLFSIGVCCMLLAVFAQRESSFLRKSLEEAGEATWAPPLSDVSPIAMGSHEATHQKRPLQTAQSDWKRSAT
jgi:Na+/melibiose symporter-like transporter